MNPTSPLDQVLVRLPCFEPNSHELELTGDMLTQHVLLTGASGFGKTTLLNRMLRDLISFQASDGESKVGLLVFDFKADGTAQRVRRWAEECGRAPDVVVLSAESDFYYDLFSGIHTFEEIDTLCAKLAVSGQPTGDNAFWDDARRTLLETALYFALLLYPNGNRERVLSFLNRYLVTGNADDPAVGDSTKFDVLLARLQRIAESVTPHPFSLKASSLLANHESWRGLDPKTRSNLTAILANTFRPFFSMAAQRYFSPVGKSSPVEVSRIVNEGKIVVLSLNAIASPELAQLLGMMLKCDFYQAVMARPEQRGREQRLVGLIADEYPLVVTGRDPRFGDVTQLQVMRSRGAFLVACTQGLVNLDIRIGEALRRALTVNFANRFFLHSNEPELDDFGRVCFGTALSQIVCSTAQPGEGGLELSGAVAVPSDVWICAPGTLGRLEKHQVFASLADGFKTMSPYWLDPLFLEAEPRADDNAGSAFSLDLLKKEVARSDWLEETDGSESAAA